MIDITQYMSQPLRDASSRDVQKPDAYGGPASTLILPESCLYEGRDLSPSPSPFFGDARGGDYVYHQLNRNKRKHDDGYPWEEDEYMERVWLQESEELVRRKIIQLANEIEEEQQNSLESLRKKIERPTFKEEQRGSPRSNRSSSPSTSSPARSTTGMSLQGDNRKRRLCRHFLKGHCKRGSSCDFLHDSSIFCPDQQKVFLGGLPASVNAELLCIKLSEMGYTVINKPKVLRGFTPQVCLASMAQAQKLIEIGKIYIDGSMVDVRPYEDKKPPDDLKRSVFLGGLPNGIRVSDIKEGLAEAGVRVCNFPIIKAGFTPQVVLGSPEEAQKLIKAKKVVVAGKLVEVRPYVNFRKRY